MALPAGGYAGREPSGPRPEATAAVLGALRRIAATEDFDAHSEICARADLVFLNGAEYRGLYRTRPHPPTPTVLKYGSGRAEFRAPGVWHRIPAPPADEVDPIGAGEILAGAFLALRARGLTEDRALRSSVAAATRSVTEFGVAGPAVTGELRRIVEQLGARDRW